MEQLIGAFQRKTGGMRESIDYFFDEPSPCRALAISWAAEAVRGDTEQATEGV